MLKTIRKYQKKFSSIVWEQKAGGSSLPLQPPPLKLTISEGDFFDMAMQIMGILARGRDNQMDLNVLYRKLMY